MADGEVVESGVFQVDYIIRRFTVDGEDKFDYISGPEESEEWYDSIAEARREARRAVEY